MNLRITPQQLHGVITPPASKSQAHRLIMGAALAGGTSVLRSVSGSNDITATQGCMEVSDSHCIGTHRRCDLPGPRQTDAAASDPLF